MKGRRGFISWAPKAKVRSQPAIPQAEDRYRFFSALLLVQGGLPPAFNASVLWIGERHGLCKEEKRGVVWVPECTTRFSGGYICSLCVLLDSLGCCSAAASWLGLGLSVTPFFPWCSFSLMTHWSLFCLLPEFF